MSTQKQESLQQNSKSSETQKHIFNHGAKQLNEALGIPRASMKQISLMARKLGTRFFASSSYSEFVEKSLKDFERLQKQEYGNILCLASFAIALETLLKYFTENQGAEK